MSDPETVQLLTDIRAQLQVLLYVAEAAAASVFGLFVYHLVRGK